MNDLAELYNDYYWSCYRDLKIGGFRPTNITCQLERMDCLWEAMMNLIPQSHLDEINFLVYNIERR